MLTTFILTNLKEILILFGSSFTTWFFVRKKQQAETTSTEIDNGQKIIELYQKSLDDLELRHKEQFEELKKMYDAKINEFTAQVRALTIELELWKTKYEASQKELKNKK